MEASPTPFPVMACSAPPVSTSVATIYFVVKFTYLSNFLGAEDFSGVDPILRLSAGKDLDIIAFSEINEDIFQPEIWRLGQVGVYSSNIRKPCCRLVLTIVLMYNSRVSAVRMHHRSRPCEDVRIVDYDGSRI